jgi:hypothetical protein
MGTENSPQHCQRKKSGYCGGVANDIRAHGKEIPTGFTRNFFRIQGQLRKNTGVKKTHRVSLQPYLSPQVCATCGTR